MLWLVLAAMAAAAVALVAIPLWRVRLWGSPGAEYDMEVYHDQLRDVERDLARGVLAPEEAEAVRLEVERRLLAADADRGKDRPFVTRWRRASALALAVFLPAAALGLYLWLGAPGTPSQPFAARTPSAPSATEMAQAQENAPPLDQAIKALAARLAQTPDDLDGWVLLGRAYLEQARYDDAADAFRHAVELGPNDAGIQFMLGESLIFAAEGVVTPAAVAALERTLKIESGNPGARFYLALSHMQAGRTQQAFDGWQALLKDTPPGAPWLKVLRRNLVAAAQELGLDPAKAVPPAPEVAAKPPAGSPGPTAADVAAAREMTPEAQSAMIEGMVTRLAERLKQEPDDLDGWLRLGRAYRVLGKLPEAQDAHRHAVALAPNDPRVAAAAAELAQMTSQGTPPAPETAANPPAGAPGPTAADITAAREMTPEAQSAMIEGMVARLAERLKQEPDDLDGWLRLGRAYRVLGKLPEAEDAYRHAATLAPDDPRVAAGLRELKALE